MQKPATRIALESVCLVCAPVLLSGLAFHWLVPAHANETSRPSLFLAQASAQPVAAFSILFLVFSFLGHAGLKLLEQRGIVARFTRAPRSSSNQARRALRFVVTVGGAAALTLLARAIVGQPYRVLSASMLPTLEPGAWIFANKLSYGVRLPGTRKKWLARMPERGDVIALETPKDVTDAAPQLVKRVIGLPGDRISMRGGRPSINDWAVPVCDAGLYTYLSGGETTQGRLLVEFLDKAAYLTIYVPERVRFAGYTVQPGEVFVLGDNRNNSSDSRAWAGGRGAGLPLTEIDGRITRALFSPTTQGNLDPHSLLEPLSAKLRPSVTDTNDLLAAGIVRCLKSAPRNTTPPASSR